jgi:hypothetical protein
MARRNQDVASDLKLPVLSSSPAVSTTTIATSGRYPSKEPGTRLDQHGLPNSSHTELPVSRYPSDLVWLR